MKILDVPADILALIALAEGPATTDWPQLEPISQKLRPVPRLSDDMLPPLLTSFVNDAADRMQAPKEYVAVPVLVGLGSVIGTGCGARPKLHDNWTISPNIWGANIGPPASKKSPALSAGISPIFHLDWLAQQDFESEQVAFVTRQFMKGMRAKELENKAKKSALTPDELRELANASRKAEPPAPKRHYTNDATIEALGEILAVNPRGVLMVNDELSGWLESLDKPGREGTRGAFLTAWNGLDPQRVDRVGRGNLYIPHFCVSVLGGIQPDMLQTYLSEAMVENRNDGLVQRLQVAVYPDLIPIDAIVDRSPDVAVIAKVREVFAKLSGNLGAFGPTVDVPGSVPYFRLEAKRAYPAFRDWLLSNENRARAEEQPIMTEHLSKYGRLVPALALIFHMVRLATDELKPGTPIDFASLTMALKWASFLEAHARRIYSMAQSNKNLAAAALAEKIGAGLLNNGFKARGIAQRGWSRLTTVDLVNDALRELEDANWVRKVKADRAHGAGRPASPTYEINPAVFATNAGTVPTKPTKRPRRR